MVRVSRLILRNGFRRPVTGRHAVVVGQIDCANTLHGIPADLVQIAVRRHVPGRTLRSSDIVVLFSVSEVIQTEYSSSSNRRHVRWLRNTERGQPTWEV